MIVITATGRLGKDAELRQTNTGENILKFSVGSDMGYGQNKSTIWLDCSIFGKRGESLASYLLKGAQVTIMGEYGQRSYVNKQGETVNAVTVKVTEIALQGGGQQQERQSYQAPAKPKQKQPAYDDLDDTIPF